MLFCFSDNLEKKEQIQLCSGLQAWGEEDGVRQQQVSRGNTKVGNVMKVSK